MMIHKKRRLSFVVFINILLSQTNGKIIRHGHHIDAAFTLVSSSMKLYHLKYLISIHNATDLYKCVEHCVRQEKCESMNYNDKEKLCEILNCSSSATEERLRFMKGWTHYETDPNAKNIGPYCQTVSPCKDTHVCEDTFERPPYICRCQDGFSGDMCDIYNGPGRDEDSPAASCRLLSRIYKSLPNAFYWIRLAGNTVKRLFCTIHSDYALGKRKETAIKSCEWLYHNNPNFETGFYWTWNRLENGIEFQRCDPEFENFRYFSNGNCSLFIDSPIILKRGTKLQTLQWMGSEYRVRCDMMINKTVSHWTDVIHFSTNNNKVKHGDRYPAVLYKNFDLYIGSSVNKDLSHEYRSKGFIKLQQWISLDISQIKDDDNNFIYSIKVNGNKVYSIVNNSPREFWNVKVYAADPWHNLGITLVRNFYLCDESIRGSSSKRCRTSHFIDEEFLYSDDDYESDKIEGNGYLSDLIDNEVEDNSISMYHQLNNEMGDENKERENKEQEIEKRDCSVYPRRITKKELTRHVNLLLTEKDGI